MIMMMIVIEMKEIVVKIPGNNLLFVRANNDDQSSPGQVYTRLFA